MPTTTRLRRPLPSETLSRLPAYRKQLMALAAEGQRVVSSRELAQRLAISDAQLRRDLSYLALTGRRGLGYEVQTLLALITQALGLDRLWPLAVIGAGAMGTALSHYPGFADSRLEVRAILDVDPAKVGQRIGGLDVEPFDRLEAIVRREGIRLAVIAVPAEAAQEVVDRLVAVGVRGFLNLAPVTLQVSPGVHVRQVDISSELQQLTHRMLSSKTGSPPPDPAR